MTDCRDIAPLLGFFEDSELEPHEMQEVARHLASCKGCEGTLTEYTTIGRHLRAVVAEPSLENFAANVQRRLDQIPVPIRMRIERYLGQLTERWTAGLAVGAAAMALGAWVFLFAPYARHYLEEGSGAGPIAISQPQAPASKSQVAVNTKDQDQGGGRDDGDVAQAPVPDGPQTVISRLEARTPDVAVWSEPETKTTVIWMPDAQ